MTNLDASPYLGRLALCRVFNGTLRRGQQAAWCRADGTVQSVKIAQITITEWLDRVEIEEAGPGEIIAIAGMADVTIGETIADLDDPRPLPLIRIDEPSISMTIGINTSPLAGRAGDKLTASMLKGRLDSELDRQRLAARCCRPSGPTPGRCAAAASCSWRCSSRRCAARASS